MSLQKKILSRCAPSYPAMFTQRVSETPDGVAFLIPPKDPESTVWEKKTWRQTKNQVDQYAAGLLALGLKPEQRVAIISNTRMDWVYADLAIACAGGATTTVYPSTHVDDAAYILADSNSAAAFVEDDEQLQKILISPELDDQIKHIIVFDEVDTDQDDRVITLDELARRGQQYLAENPTSVDDASAAVTADKLSTLIYTSGTTGRPKGVELTNQSWTFEAEAVKEMKLVTSDDLLYLWLPLSHVFGRDLLSIVISIGLAAAVDGRADRIVQGLAETNPTILVGVPRIFEKVRAAVITMNPQNGIKGRISRWAFKVGFETHDYRLEGRKLPLPLAVRYRIAHKLVFSKLHAKMGGRMRLMISGSAKLSPQVQRWFHAAGLLLIEGYGLTESAAIAFVNHSDKPKFGTVGPILPGMEAKIEDDGELLIRGPIIARGYHNLPESSAETFVDGWLRTGDIGHIDEDGYLTITDRKKDLIKTSNGKYVAPQRVENSLMANVPYLSQAVAIGEGHKYVVAIVALDPPNLFKWAERRDLEGLSYAELSQLPEIRRSLDRFIRKANSYLEPWERVQKYLILDRELSLDAEELTPSMKVRRDVVRGAFDSMILDLYEDPSIPFLDAPEAAKVDRRATKKRAAMAQRAQEPKDAELPDETETDTNSPEE